MSKSPVSEAEASIWLQYLSEPVMKMDGFRADFIRRLIQDWFRARRAAGLKSYSEESLSEAITELNK